MHCVQNRARSRIIRDMLRLFIHTYAKTKAACTHTASIG